MTETPRGYPINSPKVNLFATMYPLNASIPVGFVYNWKCECLLPKVQLLHSQYTNGVILSPDIWYKFLGHLDNIAQYFDTNTRIVPDSLSIDYIDVSFRRSHGVESIMFEQKPQDDFSSENKSRAKKLSTPAIVMQKRTFVGFRRSIFCVENRLFQLQSIASEGDQCKNLILNELKYIVSVNISKKM